jgi:hypothetical protein
MARQRKDEDDRGTRDEAGKMNDDRYTTAGGTVCFAGSELYAIGLQSSDGGAHPANPAGGRARAADRAVSFKSRGRKGAGAGIREEPVNPPA